MLHGTIPYSLGFGQKLPDAVEVALKDLPRGAYSVSVRINAPNLCGIEGMSVVVRGKMYPVYFEPDETVHPLTFWLAYGYGSLE